MMAAKVKKSYAIINQATAIKNLSDSSLVADK